ncbi:MAG TPA: gamma-glutamyltransferase, partial [Polyangiaceae bacterium]|nr:gamma-glutamyltransferase [Polyangiaceae bacterium]
VTSVNEDATRAGVAILEAGGNAVDAAVAVGFALAVTHPSAGNLGGGGFLLVRPASGATLAVDFRESAPAALTRERFDAMIRAGGGGPASVGVPGTVAGLLLAHERLGRLARRKVLEPALRLARDGHRVSARTALTLTWSYPELARDPAARAEFGAGGNPLAAGTRWVRRDLAGTLERIAAEGAPGFYAGPVAAAIARRLDGYLSTSDLTAYSARLREPLRFDYRGLTVETMPPPSAGGVALAVILLELQRQHAHELEAGSVLALHLLLEASRRAQVERRFRVVDPDRLPPEVLARRVAEWTDPARPLPGTLPIDRGRATPSAALHPLFAEALRETEHTTHYSVVDAEGMAVSVTTTLSAGYGARIVVPGTGVVLNNSVASFASTGENVPEAGRRTTSSMAPTLVLAEGRPVLVLGTPGGDTIPSTIAQVLCNVIDHGLTIDAAVDAPRVHHGFVPDELRYEAARPLPDAVLQGLRALGHAVSDRRLPIGDANDIALADGAAWGYADPREGGLALAARRAPAAPATSAGAR